LCSSCATVTCENFGFCFTLAAGSPLSETAVKIRKLVANRTGIAYSSLRITKANIGYSIPRRWSRILSTYPI
jgi:hypothetical protein